MPTLDEWHFPFDIDWFDIANVEAFGQVQVDWQLPCLKQELLVVEGQTVD
jgi:hypothetical protein